MIKSTIPVLAFNRSGKYAVVYIDILSEENDINNNQYIFIIRDYILNENGSKYEINRKEIKLSYAQRDGLKELIISQNNLEGSESEVNNQIRPHALLYYVQTDLVNELGQCIYLTNPNQWELI